MAGKNYAFSMQIIILVIFFLSMFIAIYFYMKKYKHTEQLIGNSQSVLYKELAPATRV
jgi:hypothetical protein